MPPYKRTGPVAMSATLTTNIYNPPGPEIVRNIHIVNKTGSPATFSLWLGLTGANTAGTELFIAQAIAANSVFDWPYPLKLAGTADFIVGGASAGTTLTITITTEQVPV